MKSPRSPRKEKWDMPVSRKFYTGLQQRVSSLHWNTDMPITSLGIVLDYMENYVMTRRSPDRYTADHYAYIVFIIIRPEIDAALRRSEVCRERAAERRARKLAAMEAEKASVDVPCPAIATDTLCSAISPADPCRAIATDAPCTAIAPDTPCTDIAISAPCTAIACGGLPSASEKNKIPVTPVPSRPLVPAIPGPVTACDDPTARIAPGRVCDDHTTRIFPVTACDDPTMRTRNNSTARGFIEITPYPGYDLRDGVYYPRPDTFLRRCGRSVWSDVSYP